MSQPTFFFDSSSCSGCKACQAACKDKHGLEVGRLWRRVYEISGGGWQQQGAAWVSDAYAYNLSVSCNHCEQPACVEACPTTALHKRPDGLVLIDPQLCVGCKYCTWACPYGAPQFDPAARIMTKCTGCFDHLEAGLPPACVAACPLRVLDFGDAQVMQTCYSVNGNGLVQSVAPLPEKELTQPGLLIRPHRHAARAALGAPRLANLEEVHTAPPHNELPLVLFTVLAQMAVGAFIALGLFDIQHWQATAKLPLLIVAVIMIAALLLSLIHLGRPQRAHRAIANWRTSWLSREILSAGAFTAGVVLFNFIQWVYPYYSTVRELEGIEYWFGRFPVHNMVFYLTSLAGLALVYSIARVYRLRTVREWDSWSTTAAFVATASLPGPLLAAWLMFLEQKPDTYFGYLLFYDPLLLRLTITSAWVVLAAIILQGWLAWQQRSEYPQHLKGYLQLRLGLLFVSALAVTLILVLFSQGDSILKWSITGIALGISFMAMLISELLGRWLFYEKKSHTGL